MSFLYLLNGGAIVTIDFLAAVPRPEFYYLITAGVIAMFCAIVKYPEDPKRRKVTIALAIGIGILLFVIGCRVRILGFLP